MRANTHIDHKSFLQKIYILLVVVLTIKVASYFTWSESIMVTRIVKVITRVLMTAASVWVYRSIIKRGAVASFAWTNLPAPVLYGAYLLLGLISFFWSSNVGYSALQWVMDVESLVFAYYFICSFILLKEFFPQNPIRFHIVAGNAIVLIVSVFIIGMYVDPIHFYRLTHGGEEARLGGFFMNPNELGMLAAVGISCWAMDIYDKNSKIGCVLKISLLLYAIIMTGSRSTIIGCVLILFFHIKQSANKKLMWAMYVIAFILIPFAIEKIIIKQGGIEEVMSMTGRLPFWKALITEGLPQEPYFGFGFMRISYKDYFQSVHTYAGQMTHNTFIQVLLNLGLVGLVIALWQVIYTVFCFFKTQDKIKRLLLLGVIIPILINSFTEFGIFGETNYGILFYQLLIFYISITYNALLSPKEKKFLFRKRPELVLASN